MSPLLCAMLTALLWPQVAFSALPPATTGASMQPGGSTASSREINPNSPSGTAANEASGGAIWAIPMRMRFGGSLSYDMRRSMADEGSSREQTVLSTLRAGANTYIWEPWISQLNGNLGLTLVRGSAAGQGGTAGGSVQNVLLTGSTQISVLPVTRFPFEAHFERNDSRISGDLISVENHSSQRFGFTQQYFRPNGNIMLGWDRAMQDAEKSGRDQQDHWRLNAAHGVNKHRFSLNGERARNTRIRTGESITTNNLTIQHSYAPVSTLSFDNMANVSRSGIRLSDAETHTDLAQLSTLAFWRSSTRPLTINTGVRLLAMESESSNGGTSSAVGMQARNANLNLGLNYDITQALSFSAMANANMIDAGNNERITANQTVTLNYRPAAKKIGTFNYNWGVGGAASNNTDFDGNSTSQASTQINHSLTRGVNVGEGAWLNFDVSQAFSVVKTFGLREDEQIFSGQRSSPDLSRQIAHGAGISWSRSAGGGSAMVRLSVSDSRSLDGDESYFQLINLQASTNFLASGHSSWNGSVTLQGTRQGRNNLIVATSSSNGNSGSAFNNNDQFVTTSSGAVTYQNSRLFGVRRLNFSSELRMNSNTLLPLFNGPQDQEMAAWQNRLDYSIGRTQLRMNTMLSRIKQPSSHSGIGSASGGRSRVNKAIMFSATRTFGDF